MTAMLGIAAITFLEQQRLLAVSSDYDANGRLYHEIRHGGYSQESVVEDWPPQEEPAKDYEAQPKPLRFYLTPSDPLHDGFIPLNLTE